MGGSSTFDGIVEPIVFIFGEARELDALLPAGTRAIRVAPEGFTPEPVPIALVVLDARNYPLSVLADARRSACLSNVPVLVVTDDENEPALVALGADDVIALPFRRFTGHRVRTLIELGRTRFALAFAQQALEHSVSGLTIGDRGTHDTPLVHATSVFEKITGYPLAEALGRNCRFLQGPGTDPAARATLRDAIREQRRAQVTLLNYKRDGTAFWNQVTVFPVRTASGQAMRWVGGVQHDVTSLVEARAEVDRLFALLLQKQTFDQAILDGVDVGIITTDEGGKVTFVNRGAREILHRAGELNGEDVRTTLALAGAPDTILTKQTDRRWAHTLQVGGNEIEIDLAVSRASEGNLGHLGFFFIFHDRTQEKQLEMERRRFERLAAMGTMVAGFAHEVRNPMASLRSIAESLNEELTEANVKLPHVDRMLQVLERVERLVRTSLLFGRPSPPRPSAHSPVSILSTAVSSLLPRTRPLGADLCIEAAPGLPDVFVDDNQLVQVLVILLNNALDATGSPSRVLLRAQYGRISEASRPRKSDAPLPPFVRFDVRDDGPGIPPAIMGQIFDPFFTTKAAGTGLGLSIAQQLVTENGARIELISPVGGPTTFSILVPMADAAISSR